MSETAMQSQKKGSWLNIGRDFNTMTWVLIPVAIAINIAIGQIVGTLKLPVYLDSIGTVLVGAICGPWAGALTGALANFVAGIFFGPGDWWPWIPVAAAIGLTAGICANLGLFKTWWKVAITGFLIALVAASVSSVIQVAVYGGISTSGSSLITAYLLQTGQGLYASVLSTNFLVEPVDKIATALLAFAIVKGLSKRFVARFPRSENLEVEQQLQGRQIYAAVGAVIAIIVIAIVLYLIWLLIA